MFPNSVFEIQSQTPQYNQEFCQVSSSEQFKELLKNSKFIDFLRTIQTEYIIQNSNIIYHMNDSIIEKLHDKFFDESLTFISPYLKCMLLVSSIAANFGDIDTNKIIIILCILISEDVELRNGNDSCVSSIRVHLIDNENIEEQITITGDDRFNTLNVFVLSHMYSNLIVDRGNIILYNNGIVNEHYNIKTTYKFNLLHKKPYGSADFDDPFLLGILLKDIYKESMKFSNSVVTFIKIIREDTTRYKKQHIVYSDSIIQSYLRNKYVFFDEVMEYLRVHPELSY